MRAAVEAWARYEEILAIARELGLDFFDIKFEVVPFDVMTEIAAYGLPIRAQHWTYGKVYDRQRIHGRMGLSKIFEIVINNDPAYAFLLDTNTEVENLLITAHVAAHVDFFKHNTWFQDTNRNMVNEAAEHAARIDKYRERHGHDKVERLMDIGFALDRHIDVYKGLYRKPYPARQVIQVERKPLDYADLHGDDAYSIEERVIGDRLPPHPEKDILWFLINYAPLEPWQQDVLAMIREESYYFYPQFITKIINEGWASFWHAEIINAYRNISPAEMLEFSRLHAAVVAPGPRLQVNPYYLGYRILKNIDERYGRERLFRVREEENDFSLIRNYLTEELCQDMNLFRYGPGCERHRHQPRPDCPRCGEVVIESRDLDAVIEGLLRPRYHYGMPLVVVDRVENRSLYLEQLDRDEAGLDREYAEKTLGYIQELWQAPVYLLTRGADGKDIILLHDGETVQAKPA